MEDSTQEVVKGSQLADEAGRSLNSIYTAVERQAQMIEGIAHAANEQTSVSEAVAVAMSRISEITRQTDAGTQEAAVSVSYLAELSEQLRASVSTFRLPDRVSESLGSFPNATSVTELPDQGNQMLRLSPSLTGTGSPAEPDWGQGFSANFPPVSDLGNAGSLLPMPANAGQISFSGQQDFASQANLGGISGFGNQSLDSLQTDFPNIPSFANQANSDNQQFFGNQQDFGDMSSFDDLQGMNAGLAGLQFGAMSSSLSNPGQPPYSQSNPGQFSYPLSNPGQFSYPQSNPGQFSYPQSNPGQLSYPQSNPGQLSYPQSNPGQLSYPQSNPGQPLQGIDAGLVAAPSQGGQPGGSHPRWQTGPQKDQKQ
jgi:hypothetical protein